MSHVKLSSYPRDPGDVSPLGGTKIELDGVEIKEVTRIQLDFPFDGRAECHLGIAIVQPFEFEGDMDTHVHLHVPEGCQMVEVTTHDFKGKRFMVTKVVPMLLLALLWACGVQAQDRPTPEQAVAIWVHAVPPTVIPIFYDGPTVTYTGASSPSLGPWDDIAHMGPQFNRSHYADRITFARSYPGYAWRRDLALRAWQSQDRSYRVHVLPPARFAWREVPRDDSRSGAPGRGHVPRQQ